MWPYFFAIRKRREIVFEFGVNNEEISVTKWSCIVFDCGAVYRFVGRGISCHQNRLQYFSYHR